MADQGRAGLLPEGMDPAAGRHLAATIARAGLHDLMPWDSPDTGWTDPLDDPETKAEVRSFLGRLFREAKEVGGVR